MINERDVLRSIVGGLMSIRMMTHPQVINERHVLRQ